MAKLSVHEPSDSVQDVEGHDDGDGVQDVESDGDGRFAGGRHNCSSLANPLNHGPSGGNRPALEARTDKSPPPSAYTKDEGLPLYLRPRPAGPVERLWRVDVKFNILRCNRSFYGVSLTTSDSVTAKTISMVKALPHLAGIKDEFHFTMERVTCCGVSIRLADPGGHNPEDLTKMFYEAKCKLQYPVFTASVEYFVD